MIWTRLTKPLADRFRLTVSGSKDGTPDWAKRMADGDDEGLFGPDSAVWEVHGSVSTLVGGIRALLLQAAHPAALTGPSIRDTKPIRSAGSPAPRGGS